jgi:hypothetical protein
MKLFSFSYTHEGKHWSGYIHALDSHDAMRRIGSMKVTAELFGEMIEIVPDSSGAHIEALRGREKQQ